MPPTSLVVATDGTIAHDLRVRDAALSARDHSVPLHIVCSIRATGRNSERKLRDALPRDCNHTAGADGQREAAMHDIRSLIAQSVPGLELHVTATSLRPAAAERAQAAKVGGAVYGTTPPRVLRLPSLRLRPRAAV